MCETIEGLQEALSAGFDAALGAAGPELVAYVREGRGTLPPTGKLLAWDANSVHGFVFDTTNASAIRGASSLLKGLDDDLREGAPLGLKPQQILFAGGGSGLAVVSEKQAGKALAELHRLYAERTLVATCCAVTVDLGGGEVPFNDLYEATQKELARERILRGSDAEAAVPFFAQRCEVCGRRAASVKAPRLAGTRPECEVCQHSIEAGKKSRWDEKETTDFAEIADEIRGGFLAVVYADGNGIGQCISKLTSPLAYRTFSLAIERVVGKSFDETAREYGLKEEGAKGGGEEKGNSYQRPICGGDDLVAILPGEVAVPFARDLLGRIEENADSDSFLQDPILRDLPRIGAAAGVAIGKVTFPVRHLLEEAEELLKTAKKRVYRDEDVRSALDFGEVADGSPRRESVKPERLEKGVNGMLPSGRPYSLPELVRFSERFAAVRAAALGRSQLYALRRYARAGLGQLRNHVLYQIGRRDEWRELVARLADDPEVVRDKERSMEIIVPRYGEDRIFDFADMIELHDHWREPREDAVP